MNIIADKRDAGVAHDKCVIVMRGDQTTRYIEVTHEGITTTVKRRSDDVVIAARTVSHAELLSSKDSTSLNEDKES